MASSCYNAIQDIGGKEYRTMNSHYSDYLKKSVPVDSLTFDKVTENDKELIRNVRKAHIRANRGLLVVAIIAFLACTGFCISFLLTPFDSLVYQIVSLLACGGGAFGTGNIIYHMIGGIRGIRRGVILTATRVQEVKDNRNATYQYVVDIYLEDKDETLMSYSIYQDVFASVEPGDGVAVVKVGKKVLVLEDPDRKGVMDVSNIRSGI